MKIIKRMLTLILALAMAVTMAACGDSGKAKEEDVEVFPQSHGQEKHSEDTGSVYDVTIESSPEPKPEELLIGSWVTEWDLTEIMLQYGEAMLSTHLNFGDYLKEKPSLPFHMVFREDGSVHMYVGNNDLESVAASFHDALGAFFQDALLEAIKQTMSENGVDLSNVTAWDEMEEIIGMSADDMIIASVGMDLESFLNSVFNADMLRQIILDEMDVEANYSFDGGTLKFDSGKFFSVRFHDEDSFTLDGDDNGTGLLPLTLNREA